MRRHVLAAVLTAAAGVLLPYALGAQAVCSAPHSSPSLNQSGAVGTLPAGAGWVQLSAYQQRSLDFFGPAGERRDFLADSEFLTRSLFLTAAVGVVDGIEIWAQAPVHRLTVESASGGSRTVGLGDVRIAARVGPELLPWDLPLAIRAGVKIPGSEFPVDATVLPLTEGQVDAEASLESAHRFNRLPLYLVGWAGYRLRGENREAAREPGNELFAHVGLGGRLGDVSWEVAADGLWGASPRAQGIELPSEKRRLVQLVPTLAVAIGPGDLEVTSQIPVAGKNLPTGVGLSVGYRARWGVREPLGPKRRQ